jgi:hypothetical protein
MDTIFGGELHVPAYLPQLMRTQPEPNSQQREFALILAQSVPTTYRVR